MVTDREEPRFGVSAIYGPDRGVLYRRLLAGEAFIPRGSRRWINMIHRDDVAGAIAHSLALGRPARGQVYNATDDEPVTYREFYEWLCARLNLPLPPAPERGGTNEETRPDTETRIEREAARGGMAAVVSRFSGRLFSGDRGRKIVSAFSIRRDGERDPKDRHT